MKAISLWQPWASLIATGAKTIETRSWSTRYRGPIAIHAAKRRNIDELIHHLSMWTFQGGLAPLVGKPLDLTGRSWPGVKHGHLPFGAIVAVAELYEVHRTDDLSLGIIDTDRPFGDFRLGRFAWMLRNVQALEEPIPWRGSQGFFEVPDDVLAVHIPNLSR
jgi:activating signal cointegrator 1